MKLVFSNLAWIGAPPPFLLLVLLSPLSHFAAVGPSSLHKFMLLMLLVPVVLQHFIFSLILPLTLAVFVCRFSCLRFYSTLTIFSLDMLKHVKHGQPPPPFLLVPPSLLPRASSLCVHTCVFTLSFITLSFLRFYPSSSTLICAIRRISSSLLLFKISPPHCHARRSRFTGSPFMVKLGTTLLAVPSPWGGRGRGGNGERRGGGKKWCLVNLNIGHE